MTLRRVIFWLHLLTGTMAGSVILVMAVSGALLAFEPQIVEWSERELRAVPAPAADAKRVDLDAIVAEARSAHPEGRPTLVTVRAEPRSSVRVAFGREGALYLDPYTGAALGATSKIADALHVVEDWHRWLGPREIGRPVTGVCNLAFLAMAISGVYLWWPRPTRRGALKAVAVPSFRLRGRAREFNWHNSIGIWCAPVLIVITLTGAVMSYQCANDLLYRLTGNVPPPAGGPGAGAPGGSRQARPRSDAPAPGESRQANLAAVLARAEQQVPGWVAITLRLPQRPGAPIVAIVQEPPAWHPTPRSQLALDASTAAVVSWEPFAAQNLGRRLRSWVRPLHTGEAAGIVGQAIVGLASTGGAFLVYTGIALAWRRSRGWRGAAYPVGARRSSSGHRQQVTGSTRASQPRSTTHGG
jgi:uncharacterized iron-regulated membrane protein